MLEDDRGLPKHFHFLLEDDKVLQSVYKIPCISVVGGRQGFYKKPCVVDVGREEALTTKPCIFVVGGCQGFTKTGSAGHW